MPAMSGLAAMIVSARRLMLLMMMMMMTMTMVAMMAMVTMPLASTFHRVH